MNSRELIAAFDVVADAPDGVKRLRELVLQLAVRGRLVEQDEREEPSIIALNNARASWPAKKAVKPVVSSPFALPAGWEWIRVVEAGSIQLGRQRSPDNHHGPNMVPYLRVANVQEARLDLSDVKAMNFTPEEQERFRLSPGDVLLNEGQSYELVGRPAIYRGEIPGCCFQNTLLRFRAYSTTTPEYALAVFRAYMSSGEFRAEAQQTTNIAHLSAGRLATVAFPLPPLAEQHRIVARVDELMGLLDRLEAARATRDTLRRAARDAALSALRDAEDADAVEVAWGRIAGQMDELFAEPEDVGPLRQAVLGLAVRGKLVSRVAGDTEPVMVRVGEVTEMLNGFAFSSEWYVPSGVRLVRNQNVGHGTLAWTDTKRVSQDRADEFARFQLRAGDIVLSLDRPIISTGLKVAVVREEDLPCLLLQRVCCPRPKDSRLDREFFLMWLRSPEFIGGIDPGRSNGVPHISTREVERMSLRLPGTAEQHRIVAKVDALMALCDTLEARLTTARDLHTQLAAAVVHHLEV